ncbi:CFI-box-CTERM domain-containing protein [Kaarinaea lacus]
MHEDGTVFGDFRDEYLLANIMGKAMISAYYRYSPPIANTIRDHEALRAVTPWLLTPVVYSIKYPLMFFIGLSALFTVTTYRRAIKHRRLGG